MKTLSTIALTCIIIICMSFITATKNSEEHLSESSSTTSTIRTKYHEGQKFYVLYNSNGDAVAFIY